MRLQYLQLLKLIIFQLLFLHKIYLRIITIPIFLQHDGRQRNRVFATNSDFLITLSLETNVGDRRYFKLCILFKYLILFQRLNSFI